MKTFIIILIALILVGAGYYVYDQKAKKAQAPATFTKDQTDQLSTTTPEAKTVTPATSTPATQPPSNESGGTFSSGEEDPGVDILVKQIDYDGDAFNPKTVDIKAGDIIIFKNNSTSNFWPASGPHPSHTNYPEFDAQKAIAPGGKYQFQFTKPGSWNFHDHLNPTAQGTISVSK